MKTAKEKKPYKKPVIKSEKILETAALACGKCLAGNPVSQSSCKNRPQLS